MKLASLILIGALSVSQAIKLHTQGENDQLISLGQKLGLEVTADMFEGHGSLYAIR